MTLSTPNSLLLGAALPLPMVGSAAGGRPLSQEPVLAHDAFGDGPQKVLVLHSWMGDAASFDPMKPYLDTHTYTYVFADLRGYGRSRDMEGEYNLEEASADTLRLADSLGWDRFHLIGHSMSGMVVQRLAIDDWTSGRRRIKGVVAITPVTADGYPADEQTRRFLWELIHDRVLTEQGVAGLTGERLLSKWARVQTERHLRTSRPDAMRGYYRMWMDTDISDEAADAQVGTPILVIGARQDPPGFQEQKYRSTFSLCYPNVDLQFITDAGHFPMYETPVYLATLVEGFLGSHTR
jgi:pimeloyl-ACP methyl ester carboxylesterase